VFDSSKIPGEIMDLMVVRTDAPDRSRTRSTGAWYETMAIMQTPGASSDERVDYMAKASGARVDQFKAQLGPPRCSTRRGRRRVRGFAEVGSDHGQGAQFSFARALFGAGRDVADAVGIELDDGRCSATSNVKLRFTAKYMKAAADGKL
jgi:NitT/TauT family transport system substrate-binding protein